MDNVKTKVLNVYQLYNSSIYNIKSSKKKKPNIKVTKVVIGSLELRAAQNCKETIDNSYVPKIDIKKA